MSSAHRFLMPCIFILALLAAGCAVPNQTGQPFVRAEHLCALSAGNPDPAAVKADLGSLLAYVPGGIGVKYYKKHNANVMGMIAGAQNVRSYADVNTGIFAFMTLSTIQVTDSRVTVSNQIYFDYDELEGRAIDVNEKVLFTSHPYNVFIEGIISFSFADRDLAQCVAEELRLILQPMWKQQQEEALGAFQAVVDQYRAMAVKPPVSEEQRRYIVQANALTQKKDYAQAVSLYEKALEISPFSYPAAYYNMALLSAQDGRYTAAIINMKKYLLLVPEAEDARAAQDKIYEWEALGGAQ
jgi:tetratricopeptide (TPR) repeat protein